MEEREREKKGERGRQVVMRDQLTMGAVTRVSSLRDDINVVENISHTTRLYRAKIRRYTLTDFNLSLLCGGCRSGNH